MKNTFLRAVAVTALSALSVSTVGIITNSDIASASPSVDVYAELARTASVRVSPDGKYVAMLSPYQGGKGIYIYMIW